MSSSVSSQETSTSLVTSHLSNREKKSEKCRHFIAHSIVEISDFFSSKIKAELVSILDCIFSLHEVRRDFKMSATGDTSRRYCQLNPNVE